MNITRISQTDTQGVPNRHRHTGCPKTTFLVYLSECLSVSVETKRPKNSLYGFFGKTGWYFPKLLLNSRISCIFNRHVLLKKKLAFQIIQRKSYDLGNLRKTACLIKHPALKSCLFLSFKFEFLAKIRPKILLFYISLCVLSSFAKIAFFSVFLFEMTWIYNLFQNSKQISSSLS